MPDVPTTMQLDLFRAVEDVHDMTQAIVVLLVDGDGTTMAVSGDEADLPPPLRAVLAGKKLQAAGTVAALLEPVLGELGGLNVNVQAIGHTHLLVIVFDSEADFETVQSVGPEAKIMIGEILAGAAN